MNRQFTVGQHGWLGGLYFRVEEGTKKPGDLLLKVRTKPRVFEPVRMRTVGMIHAFMCENEDWLYNQPGQLGAEFWRTWLRVCEEDWRGATTELARQQAWARRAGR